MGTSPSRPATRSAGKLTFTVLAGIAEFEREMIRERVKAGMAAAKARGQRIGRRRIPMGKQSQIRRLRSEGMSFRKTASELGISVGTAVSYSQTERR